MTPANRLAVALVAAGIVLLITPAFVPVQQVLYHDTGAGTTANASQLAERGTPIVPYGDLSERGQELYVAALRNGGEYEAPDGTGAPDFDYTPERGVRGIVVERPLDSDLPPADEPVRAAEQMVRPEEDPEGTPTEPSEAEIEQRRQEIARYDLMSIRRGTPPLDDAANLVRLLSAVLGILAVRVGGYRASLP